MIQDEQIISFAQGILVLKLREEWKGSRYGALELHHTIARIAPKGIEVRKTDSHGEVSSDTMTLSKKETNLLVLGIEMVDNYWMNDPLPEKHVLLKCGCIIDWDTYQEDWNTRMGRPAIAYDMPIRGEFAWCDNCEDTTIFRFDLTDFIGEDEGEDEREDQEEEEENA